MFSKQQLDRIQEMYNGIGTVKNLENGKGLSIALDPEKLSREQFAETFMQVTGMTYDHTATYTIEVDDEHIAIARASAEKYGLTLTETDEPSVYRVERASE